MNIDKLEEVVKESFELLPYRYDFLFLIQQYREKTEELVILKTKLKLMGIDPNELLEGESPASQRANQRG